ncbi:hypothetical protein P280DRAFT_467822 [Massarina eburnea CBS 473.64]|uniref:Uncharacterized protein n=1 Tax=Massarina eburnea CBS 473.64 TaxID=1395130 RepID=A0A6A6S3J8_9PLEO|nr:hypothetical protein P280DRAFT_467822 [Massarina eburnea CBS 473.64]
MTSSAPQPPTTVPSSAFHEGDTALALATLVPYSSDGPTLPLIGGASEHSSNNTKRKVVISSGVLDAQSSNESAGKLGKKRKSGGVEENGNEKKKPKISHDDLFSPWMLLPSEIRTAVQRRLDVSVVNSKGKGIDWWERKCAPIVYTRNQNIKSGINRLKAYLGYEKGTVEIPSILGRGEGGVIAVSAQGEATTKLVGILEVVRRVVGGDGKEGDGKREGVRWYMYTSLASKIVSDGKTTDDSIREKHEDEGFEARASREEGNNGKGRKIPVLTVWLSRESILEFKRELGEQSFDVLS